MKTMQSRWKIITMVLIIVLAGCDNKNTPEEIAETDLVPEFTVTLNGEKYTYTQIKEGNENNGNIANDGWTVLIRAKEADGGPTLIDFIINFTDSQFTVGEKQLNFMALDILESETGNSIAVYREEPGTANFEINRIEEGKTVGGPEFIEITNYILDGSFSATMFTSPLLS